MIASPEGALAMRSDAGHIIADLDLDRLAYLHSEDQRIEVPRRCLTSLGCYVGGALKCMETDHRSFICIALHICAALHNMC